MMIASPATAAFLRQRQIRGPIVLLGGGPGSGCRGPNCGRPRGPEALPGPTVIGPSKTKAWTPEARVSYVTAMGKSWVDKIIAGDSKIQAAMTEASGLDTRYKATDEALGKLGGWLSHYWNTPSAERNVDTLEKVENKSTALAEKMGNLWSQQQLINKDISRRIADKLDKENTGYKRLEYQLKEIDPNDIGPVTAAIRSFDRMVGMAGRVNVTSTGGIGVAGHERSYYRNDTNTIYLRQGAGYETVWHELGHMMEHNTPGGTLAALSYLDSRTKGEQEKKLSEIDRGKPGYMDSEVSRKDNFTEPYIGKIYKNGDATEVTSMGMQYLAEDPARLYRMDKDHLYFTLGMIRAAQTGGFPWAKASKS